MADLLSAISVFLVFLTFLFNSIEKEINETINSWKPEIEQKEKMKIYKRNLSRVIFIKSLPITLIYLVSFVFIEIGILGLTVYSAIKTL